MPFTMIWSQKGRHGTKYYYLVEIDREWDPVEKRSILKP